MALIEGREYFGTIRNVTRFSLLLPEEGAEQATSVLLLLPVIRGLSTDWVRYTTIERIAQKYRLAVVMPEGISSDFCNMVNGMKWKDYLTEEFPAYLKRIFGLSTEHCLCFGAGMGADASIRLALTFPERFPQAGAVDADYLKLSRYSSGEEYSEEMESVYGKAPVGQGILEENDPLRLAAADLRQKATLFLHHGDRGAEQLSSVYGQPVRWLHAQGENWEKYDACLAEFLKDTEGSENG